MKLIVKGREGKRVVDWESYALLRDNVQHFIEQGEPNGRFPALHGIEKAVDRGQYIADAARLRGEVLRAAIALRVVPLGAAALTLRTRAIMTGSSERPAASPTVPAQTACWSLPISGSSFAPIPRIARKFIEAVLAVTETAEEGELLQIRRAGDAPVFARP
jgi:hypothetical protein